MKHRSQPHWRPPGSQGHLHHNLIVMLAVDLHLPRQTTAWDKTQTLVERLCTCVACPHVDDQLFVAARPSEREGVRCQLPADSVPAPLVENEGAKLPDMIHRMKELRPFVEALEADDKVLRSLGQDQPLSCGKR